MSTEPPTRPNPISPSPDPDATRVNPAVPPASGDPAQDRPRRNRRVGLVVTLVLLVLLAGVYLAGSLMGGDRLPRNTTVAGIAVGGLTSGEAVDKLTAEFSDQAAAPITVTVEGTTHEVEPDEAGLAVDYAGTVRAGGLGRSFSPVHVWQVLRGGGDVKPVVTVDEPKLASTVDAIAGDVSKPAVDATVTFEGAEVQRTPAEPAVDLVQEELATALTRAYPLSTEVAGEVRRTEPNITDAEADEAIQAYATPALSGPVTVETSAGTFNVTPAMIGASSRFEVTDGKLTGHTDPADLYEWAESAVDELDLKQTQNARYERQGESFAVIPSSDGLEISQDNFEKAVMPAVLSENRRVTAEITQSQAKFTTEDAEKQKPREVIGEYTTSFPHAAYRNTNLGLAANRIDGRTLPVGEVFSLDKALGDRSAYVDGWVVSGGRMKQENAGGISQSATTVFNAAWFAGLEDVEHQPHTLYFDRYPAGRESTIYSGHIDVKFRNTTDNAIYVQSYRTPSSSGGSGAITVKIWGTKKWNIVSPEPTKSGYYSGRTITESGSNCTPQSASPGFTARYYRLFQIDGQTVKREDKSWKYSATDEVRCV